MAFADSFLRGVQQGEQARSQQASREDQAEERKIRKEALALQQRQIKIQEMIEAYKLKKQGSLDLLGLLRGQSAPTEQLPAGVAGPPAPLPRTPVDVPISPDIPELGLQGQSTSVLPMYREDVLLQDQAQKAAEARIAQEAKMEDIPPELAAMLPGLAGASRVSPNVLETARTVRGQQATATEKAADRAVTMRGQDLDLEGKRLTATEKPLSGEASKTLSVAQTMIPEINKLKVAFGFTGEGRPIDKRKYSASLKGYLLGTDRTLVKLVDQVADKVGRLRSGGAINKDEEARFKRQIASLPDALFGDSEGSLAALDGIIAEADTVVKGVTKGAKAATGATGAGAGNPTTAEEYLKSLGR